MAAPSSLFFYGIQCIFFLSFSIIVHVVTRVRNLCVNCETVQSLSCSLFSFQKKPTTKVVVYVEMVPRARRRHLPVYRGVLAVCQRPCDKTQVGDNGGPSSPYSSSSSPSSSSSSSPCSFDPFSIPLCLPPLAAVFVQHRLLPIQSVSSTAEGRPCFTSAHYNASVFTFPHSTIRTTQRCRHGGLLLKQRSLTGLWPDPCPRP